jgi:transcriptional regulator with XRE-family HTH domain
MKIGKQLKKLRLTADLTQEELGKKVNLSRANISKYESDDIEPNLTTLKLFATVFGVKISTVLGETDESVPVYARNERSVPPAEENKVSVGDILGSNNGVIGVNHGSLTAASEYEQALPDDVKELLRIYKALDFKERMKVLNLVFELEENRKAN